MPVVDLAEFRATKGRELQSILQRPGMHARDAWSMYTLIGPLVRDLAVLHDLDRAEAWHPVSPNRFDEYGVPGLERWFKTPPYCPSETASLYAEVASRLGLIAVQRRVSPEDWSAYNFDTGAAFETRDWTIEALGGELPTPSLLLGKHVACFAPVDPAAGWTYLDFHWEPEQRTLRNVRLPTAKAIRGLVFTPFGRQYDNRD